MYTLAGTRGGRKASEAPCALPISASCGTSTLAARQPGPAHIQLARLWSSEGQEPASPQSLQLCSLVEPGFCRHQVEPCHCEDSFPIVLGLSQLVLTLPTSVLPPPSSAGSQHPFSKEQGQGAAPFHPGCLPSPPLLLPGSSDNTSSVHQLQVSELQAPLNVAVRLG